jgi:hypothetical protein
LLLFYSVSLQQLLFHGTFWQELISRHAILLVMMFLCQQKTQIGRKHLHTSEYTCHLLYFNDISLNPQKTHSNKKLQLIKNWEGRLLNWTIELCLLFPNTCYNPSTLHWLYSGSKNRGKLFWFETG